MCSVAAQPPLFSFVSQVLCVCERQLWQPVTDSVAAHDVLEAMQTERKRLLLQVRAGAEAWELSGFRAGFVGPFMLFLGLFMLNVSYFDMYVEKGNLP